MTSPKEGRTSTRKLKLLQPTRLVGKALKASEESVWPLGVDAKGTGTWES